MSSRMMELIGVGMVRIHKIEDDKEQEQAVMFVVHQ